MKFIKLLILLLATIYVNTTDVTKFRHKNTHSKKAKTFLRKIDEGLTAISPTAGASANSFNQNSDFAKQTNILDMVPDKEASVVDLKLGPGPVHFKGCVKFFKLDSDESQTKRPTTFFKNMEFFQQSRKFQNQDLTKKDEDGENDFIKNEMYFYAQVNFESINILNSKLDKFQHTYDTLNIDLIVPQVEDKNFIGGITDFGSFSEGFCFRVNSSNSILTELPKADAALKSWIFCSDTAVIFIFYFLNFYFIYTFLERKS